jgi:hypothetical protein
MTRSRGPGLDAVLARSDRVVGRKVAGEYVLVPLAGGAADIDSVYGLSGVGVFIWEHLDGQQSGREIVRSLQETYAVAARQAARDYLRFVRDLLALGAVRTAAR